MPYDYKGLTRWLVSLAWCWSACCLGGLCFLWKSIKMNCHKLVNFEEFLLPGEQSSAEVSWTYVSTIHGPEDVSIGGYICICKMSSQPDAWLLMSSWPYVVLLLTTRCLYWGVHLTVYCIFNCVLQNVKMTLGSTGLGHQMPLPGGYIWLSTAFSIACFRMAPWPYIVLLMATRCLYWGYISSEIMNSFWVWLLHHRGLFYKRPIMN